MSDRRRVSFSFRGRPVTYFDAAPLLAGTAPGVAATRGILAGIGLRHFVLEFIDYRQQHDE